MKRNAILITLAGILMTGAGSDIACEDTAGETKFLDYADCRYGLDAIVVVDLPEGA